MDDMRIVRAEALKDFCAEALIRLQVPEGDAAIIADSMVDADLRGVHTHGVTHFAGYARMLREGNMNPRPSLKVIREAKNTALIDADNAVGNLGVVRAMQKAVDKAKASGLAAVALINSTHCGALAYFTTMAAQQGVIAFLTNNGPPRVPPYGGKSRTLSTNPWSYGIPAGKQLPIILDMAVTVVAGGKIRLAQKKGQKIPVDWALDQDGLPTDDPVKAMAGFSQWMGGPKGYGLAVVSDVLAGVLTGGSFGLDFPPTTEPYGSSLIRSNHFMTALDIESFMPLSEFTGRIDRLISQLKSSERVQGVEEIYLPGEREFKLKEERLRSGLPLASEVWSELDKVRVQLGIQRAIPFTS
ncbi:MAG: Ldh family oxidoreductase [Acidobacteriota bacterium]|jgi:LDH2 family malate/lactate/ureidoglycolate dehydrogenase